MQITEDTKPKILKAVVSPAVFVDSRRGIRDHEKFMVIRRLLSNLC